MVFSQQPLQFLVSVVLLGGLTLSAGAGGRIAPPHSHGGVVAARAPTGGVASSAAGEVANGAPGGSDDPVMVSGRV